MAYLRCNHRAHVGHNPVGAISVEVILVTLCVQGITGLFATDVDGIASGPLSRLVSFDQGRAAASIHHVSFTVLEVLICCHIAAIAFYALVRRRNLVMPMITGRSSGLADAAGLEPGKRWLLVFALIESGVIAWWIVRGAPL